MGKVESDYTLEFLTVLYQEMPFLVGELAELYVQPGELGP